MDIEVMHHIYLYTHPPKTARTCEVNVDTFCERLETKNETLMQIVELNLVLGYNKQNDIQKQRKKARSYESYWSISALCTHTHAAHTLYLSFYLVWMFPEIKICNSTSKWRVTLRLFGLSNANFVKKQIFPTFLFEEKIF